MISYKELKIYKYELTEIHKEYIDLGHEGLYVGNYIWYSPSHHVFSILAGYRWDGPSGPTVDTETFMRGSLVHDALYQAIREGHLPMSARAQADKILYRMCREDGMGRIRAWYTYRAVRVFGKSSAQPGEMK